MRLEFRPTSDPVGMRIVDGAEGVSISLESSEALAPGTIPTDRFHYPVDRACTVDTSRLTFHRNNAVIVRDGGGNTRTQLQAHQTVDFEYGTYSIEINGDVRVYCRVTAALRIKRGADYLIIDATERTAFDIGARSHHKRPAGTITTTEDPTDVMQALSALSSSLKTLSSERSWPTLRGYPPLVEVGDSLEFPEEITMPNSGVRIVVPPDLRHIYTVAPLAYYTGARIAPGFPPRIETDHGFEYPLDGHGRFEDAVSRSLRQIFLLDCIVRTEGFYTVELYQRSALEPELPFDIGSLYGIPLERQLEEYLSIDFEVVRDHIPNWVLTAHLPMTIEYVAAIPHVLSSMGLIRHPDANSIKDPTQEFSPTTSIKGLQSREQETHVQEKPLDSNGKTDSPRLVEPRNVDESIENTWFGDHIPLGASKATIEAFESKIRRTERVNTISIDVVCNDRKMFDEQEYLLDIYGSRKDTPYEINTYEDLTRDELADLLENSTSDFLHFIGHSSEDGLSCPDGSLDVRNLNSVNHDAFLLNACESYYQAAELTKRGAIGGVSTMNRISNREAIQTGGLLANALNLGFPLRAALSVIRDYIADGDQYVIVGDGTADIVQPDMGVPAIVDITVRDDDRYELQFEFYSNQIHMLGSLSKPKLDAFDERYIVPGTTNAVTIDGDALEEFLYTYNSLLRYQGELIWTQEYEYPDLN